MRVDESRRQRGIAQIDDRGVRGRGAADGLYFVARSIGRSLVPSNKRAAFKTYVFVCA
jgi:hypothetical protein